MLLNDFSVRDFVFKALYAIVYYHVKPKIPFNETLGLECAPNKKAPCNRSVDLRICEVDLEHVV